MKFKKKYPKFKLINTINNFLLILFLFPYLLTSQIKFSEEEWKDFYDSETPQIQP